LKGKAGSFIRQPLLRVKLSAAITDHSVYAFGALLIEHFIACTLRPPKDVIGRNIVKFVSRCYLQLSVPFA
jgi:hypothetical protein